MRNAASKAAGALLGLALAVGTAGAQTRPLTPQAMRPVSILYAMDQVATGPLPREVFERLKPLHTLQEVEDVLKVNRIAFGWRRVEIGTEEMAPGVAEQIAALPPHEVFIAPQGQGWLMSVVVGRR